MRFHPIPDASLKEECHLLITLFQTGHYAEVERRASILTDTWPTEGFIWKLLGAAMAAQGKSALFALQRATAMLPDDAEAFNNLGVAQISQGLFAQALESCSRAVELAPTLAAAHNNLGNALKAVGQAESAAVRYCQAVALAPDLVAAHLGLGKVLIDLGQLDEAALSLQRALQLAPEMVEARFHLGVTQHALMQLEAAADSYRRVLIRQSDSFDAQSNLGNVLCELGRFEEAQDSFRHALALRPDDAETHFNLGNTLKAQGQWEQAAASYRRTLAIKPELVLAQNNLGVTLKAMGRTNEALACYRAALKIDPTYAIARQNAALILLCQGNFEEGWELNRARVSDNGVQGFVPLPKLPFAQWQGEPLLGKSLLIVREQGLGDEIQFCRYVPLLKRMGVGRITLACKPALQELMATLDGVDALHVLEPGNARPPNHDFWTLMLDIPYHLATRLDNIPANIPYLSANSARMVQVASILNACLPGGSASVTKVGLCWKGNSRYKADAQRSFGLTVLDPLLSVPGVRYFSLQPDTRVEFLAWAGPCGVDLGHEIDADGPPFRETAALIMQLDLVITCDTSIGHLAAALGKPVWVLLPFVSDWRWIERREDSPWYPNTRLFRQRQPGNWATPVQRVRDQLVLLTTAIEPVAQSERGQASDFTQMPLLPVSWGEVFDKLTILQIKIERISELSKRVHIERELSEVQSAIGNLARFPAQMPHLIDQLKRINDTLWDVEDALRQVERNQAFDDAFIQLARQVYIKNDRRALLKSEINALLGSALVEQKSYAAY